MTELVQAQVEPLPAPSLCKEPTQHSKKKHLLSRLPPPRRAAVLGQVGESLHTTCPAPRHLPSPPSPPTQSAPPWARRPAPAAVPRPTQPPGGSASRAPRCPGESQVLRELRPHLEGPAWAEAGRPRRGVGGWVRSIWLGGSAGACGASGLWQKEGIKLGWQLRAGGGWKPH